MNTLESQVTDLNYLAESPIAFTGSMSGQHQSSSTESPAETGTNSGKKRKSEEANGNGNVNTHTRAKRNRYISIAWWVISIFPVQLIMTFCAGFQYNLPQNALRWQIVQSISNCWEIFVIDWMQPASMRLQSSHYLGLFRTSTILCQSLIHFLFFKLIGILVTNVSGGR
jgi:hypothetical protein